MRFTATVSKTPARALPGPGFLFSRSRGFTLIELMIVVAIISLLASIAIPNFLKFQCKSKQGEAKSGLGALFISEKTFFSEHNAFGTDLVFVNWQPEGAPLYLYGFNGANFPNPPPADLPGYDGSRDNTAHPSVIGSPARYSTARMKDLTGSPLATGSLPATACNASGFVLGAVSDIAPDSAISLDQWTIDSMRTFTNITNDCYN